MVSTLEANHLKHVFGHKSLSTMTLIHCILITLFDLKMELADFQSNEMCIDIQKARLRTCSIIVSVGWACHASS
uniref:Uncharacterized protein n=1 Tax=Vibrio splendidus TaxID=29497 RepID=A0A0H3ZJE0_VIBSP|nr:hypothetical protein [Vibrio splendidus]